MERKILKSNIWWTQNENVPSKYLKDNFGTNDNYPFIYSKFQETL